MKEQQNSNEKVIHFPRAEYHFNDLEKAMLVAWGKKFAKPAPDPLLDEWMELERRKDAAEIEEE